MFEEQVEKSPNNIAVVYEDIRLTYRELNDRANQLASYLKQIHDIKPDTLIALCLDRSEYMLIAILGVLKAGGAYVPMDPNYPDERIKYILEDTGAKVVVTNEIYRKRLEELVHITNVSEAVSIVAIDSERTQQQIMVQSVTNLATETTSTNLAYVIYTSGTTGQPKGVMIEHKGVVNYILNTRLHELLLPGDKVDFSTNIGFDLTVTTTVCALCLGTQVIVYNNQLQDLESYKDYLTKNEVNVVKLVPSYFELLIEFLPTTKINKVILGGEKLSPSIIDKLYNLYNDNKDGYSLIVYD